MEASVSLSDFSPVLAHDILQKKLGPRQVAQQFLYCPAPGCEFAVECLGGDERKLEGPGGTGNSKSNEEKIRKLAKQSLDKYIHYYERWIGNHNSRKKALADIEELQTKHLEKLRDIHYCTMSQLQFIKDALVQVAECRRILKWSYAYGYYFPENEPAKNEFFEYIQGEAEMNLERLHGSVEQELSKHSSKEAPPTEFTSYSAKVVDLTKVTRAYFQNLGTALANGLTDGN
ncbi:OLC1v1028959C1 [Oldenlandia corymbosa var. corymbosa]|uniref:OLC1v1028959C1 n=1 Tax=Oldenlandia corymbosa var. corymbosa TaxID=529605 RepID=A0AAV1CDC8_OLDCO|nr:OLC1v1028959C1 [Oldenlandia corymbosa var. corymbosa]